MSDRVKLHAEWIVVLRALRLACGVDYSPGKFAQPYTVALRTPQFLASTGDGHRAQPMGEAKVRRILNQLNTRGLVIKERRDGFNSYGVSADGSKWFDACKDDDRRL